MFTTLIIFTFVVVDDVKLGILSKLYKQNCDYYLIILAMLIERLKQYIDFKNLNIYAFERSVGLSNNTIRKKLDSGRNNMATETLQAILRTYPDLSADWLLLGTGEMIKQEKEIDATMVIIKQQQQTIADLTKSIATLIENTSK